VGKPKKQPTVTKVKRGEFTLKRGRAIVINVCTLRVHIQAVAFAEPDSSNFANDV